jgi:uncharacterized surface protein with fasciclin (FAS1) repeats
MKYPRFRSGCTLAIAVFLFASCSKPDSAPNENLLGGAESNRGQAYVNDPNSRANILQIALGSEDHTTLVAAVKAAELENVLVNAGPLTVFAPTNAAFDKLPAGTLEELLKPENKQKLARIITSHAAPGTYAGSQLKDGMKLYQATGHYVDVVVNEEGTFVNGVQILATVDASNGVVHVVDEVFLIAAG